MIVPSLYVYPILHTLYHTPRPISYGCLLRRLCYIDRLNLKTVTVGKIWLQKIQINNKKLKFYNRFFRFLELLWMYINIRIGPKHTNITI